MSSLDITLLCTYLTETFFQRLKPVEKRTKFAKVAWVIEDILSLRPEWSDEKAEEWLSSNEKYIQEIMVERGWEAIDGLLPAKENEET